MLVLVLVDQTLLDTPPNGKARTMLREYFIKADGALRSTTRALRFLRAVRTHLMTARYVLLAALSHYSTLMVAPRMGSSTHVINASCQHIQ